MEIGLFLTPTFEFLKVGFARFYLGFEELYEQFFENVDVGGFGAASFCAQTQNFCRAEHVNVTSRSHVANA